MLSRPAISKKQPLKKKSVKEEIQVELTKAEISTHDFQKDSQVYQNIIRELGNIRNRVDKVLSDFQEHCEQTDSDSIEEINDDYQRLMAKYEGTQEERNKLLYSLKAFFKKQFKFLNDGDVSTVSDVDLEKQQFMDAWYIALFDIEKLRQINQQLLDLGKEMNSLPSTEPISRQSDEGLIGKQQRDHMYEMFTKEAVANLRVSRDLQGMSKEVTMLRKQNEELLEQKMKEEARVHKLVDAIRVAENEIKELQSEVVKGRQNLAVANGSARRFSRAYIQMKNDFSSLTAVPEVTITSPTDIERDSSSTVSPQQSKNSTTGHSEKIKINLPTIKFNSKEPAQEVNIEPPPVKDPVIKREKRKVILTQKEQSMKLERHMKQMAEKRNKPRSEVRVNTVSFLDFGTQLDTSPCVTPLPRIHSSRSTTPGQHGRPLSTVRHSSQQQLPQVEEEGKMMTVPREEERIDVGKQMELEEVEEEMEEEDMVPQTNESQNVSEVQVTKPVPVVMGLMNYEPKVPVKKGKYVMRRPQKNLPQGGPLYIGRAGPGGARKKVAGGLFVGSTKIATAKQPEDWKHQPIGGIMGSTIVSNNGMVGGKIAAGAARETRVRKEVPKGEEEGAEIRIDATTREEQTESVVSRTILKALDPAVPSQPQPPLLTPPTFRPKRLSNPLSLQYLDKKKLLDPKAIIRLTADGTYVYTKLKRKLSKNDK